MVAAALAVDRLFAAAGLIPEHCPSIDSITSRGISWNYTTVLNIVFLLVAGALFGDQIAAARTALERVGLRLLESHARHCVRSGAADVDELMAAVERFSKVR